jgi:hypothetical protein
LQHEEFAINQSPKNMMTLVIGCSSSLNVLKSQKIFLGSSFGSHCEELVALMREDEFFAELCKQNKKKKSKSGELKVMVFVTSKNFFVKSSMRLHLGVVHTVRIRCGANQNLKGGKKLV